MNKIYFLLAFSVILLISCKKETSNESGLNSGGNSGTLLTKKVSQIGQDSTVTSYKYDGSKRLIRITITGMFNGTDIGSDFIIQRNSSGIITKTIQTSNSQTDSLVRLINYDVNSKRYTSVIHVISDSGQRLIDSTVFIYDGSGKITEEDRFASLAGYSLLLGKGLFTYNSAGNNIISSVVYADTAINGTLTEIGTLNYTYDSKNRPLSLAANKDAFAAGMEDLFNANNILAYQLNDLIDPANSFTQATTYTYNASNYPIAATIIQSPGNYITTDVYYYQ